MRTLAQGSDVEYTMGKEPWGNNVHGYDNWMTPLAQDEVAEWLRRWTANPLGSARVGSNPILVDAFLLSKWDGHMISNKEVPFYVFNVRCMTPSMP